jgi:hypothetical protein
VINGELRPWGKPKWLLQMEALRTERWLLIGAISTQDRCLSMLRHSTHSFTLGHAAFLEIIDKKSVFHVQSDARREANRLRWQTDVAGYSHERLEFGLLDPLLRLKKQVGRWISGAYKKSVILDVTCLPERFFFPMIRWLVDSVDVENLIVTCMSPERYTEEDLAYDPEDWAHIQTFGPAAEDPEKPVKRVIVGAGFLPFSLPELLKKDYNANGIQVSVLFPFPAPPANIKRSWEFVRKIEVDLMLTEERQLARVGANDLSGCFDRIDSITRNGSIGTVFAPYGPKAHSIAMCLQAMKMKARVIYTQPTFYHPEYTTGIKLEDGVPAGFAYAIRVNSLSLY